MDFVPLGGSAQPISILQMGNAFSTKPPCITIRHIFIMLRVASSSYCLEQSLIELHQLLCELCYSSWLDTWENVTLTTGQADVVLITVHKWKELLFLTQDFAISHSQNISILLNSTMTAIALINFRLVRHFWRGWGFYICSRLFESPTFYGMNSHMWSCLIAFLHYLLITRPRSTFLLSHQITFLFIF